MTTKKKFYAVAAGRVPGIYDNWPQAKAQVDGFAGARYKGFADR
ncbi:viroplasmin family protein, partial [Desulfurivibrio sp. C05AmB]